MGGLVKTLLVLALLVGGVGVATYAFISSRRQSDAAQNSAQLASPSPQGDEVGDGTVKFVREITVITKDYKFEPNQISLIKGETVKITLKNEGAQKHDMMVEKMEGASIDVTNPKETSSITITPSQKGTFNIYCSVSNHKAQGMIGKLVVE